MSLLTFFTLAFENLASENKRWKYKQSFWKLTHFLFTLTLLLEMFINGVFWFGMHPFAILNLWGKIGFIDIMVPICEHAVPLILFVVDLNINEINVWNYAYMPIMYIFLIFYFVINCYYSVTVMPVYPVINYRNWLSLILVVSCVFVVPLCNLIARQYCYYFKETRITEILRVPLEDMLELSRK